MTMSLTRGDAHTNSRRWLTPRRHSDKNHLSPIVFFLGPRRDLETCQLGKLEACPLLAEGYTKKLRQNLVFDPGGSTGHFCAYPFWKCGARCFVERFSFGSGWWQSGALFDRMRTSEYHFSE